MNPKLKQKILNDCTAIDTDARYRDMLNEVYGPALERAQEEIPFLRARDAASLMEENDPTMYWCGFADWLDSESREHDWIDVTGAEEYFERKDCENAKEELVRELEGDLEAGDTADAEALQKEIDELNDFCF